MDTHTYVLLLFGALAGGFVSGLAGFGTALMALGIWLYVLPPSLAVPLVLICSVIAQTSTLPSMWKSFDLSLVWPFLIGGLIGVPLGTMMVASADPKVFKLSVGVLLLIFSSALYLNKRPLAIKNIRCDRGFKRGPAALDRPKHDGPAATWCCSDRPRQGRRSGRCAAAGRPRSYSTPKNETPAIHGNCLWENVFLCQGAK